MAVARKRPQATAPDPGAAGIPPVAPAHDSPERRGSGLLRVPFVRRCALRFNDGREAEAFLVNINILGAYVAHADLPHLGEAVCCRFAVPGNETQIELHGVVAWVNPRQPHPVHSLPPGFGLRFREVPPDSRRRIEQVIEDYDARHPRR